MSLFICASRRRPIRGRHLCTAVVLCTLLTSTLAPTVASAEGLGGGIDAFLRDWEGQMTSAKPNFYEGQSRGYVFGGSLDMRFPNRNPAPITVSLPSVKSGCGGISFFGGAFSFINMEEFTQYLQAIAQNAMGMAFQAALTWLCPQCSAIMNTLEEKVRNVTANLKSSCTAARGFLSAATPENLAAQSAENCQKIKDAMGSSADWFDGGYKCGKAGEAVKADQAAATDWLSQLNRLTQAPQFTQGNLFWQAYQRVNGSLPEFDEAFGEQLMSLLGTTVVTPSGQTFGFYSIPPRIEVHDLLDGWQTGKELLSCNDWDMCLEVSSGAGNAYEGLNTAIRKHLEDFATAVGERRTLLPDPYITTNIMGFPIARLIVNTRAIPGGNERIIGYASKYLAAQILTVYIRNLFHIVDAEVGRLKDNGHLKDYRSHLGARRRDIDAQLARVHQDLSNGIRDLQAFINLVNASQGASSNMFSRHNAFSAKGVQTPNAVGH